MKTYKEHYYAASELAKKLSTDFTSYESVGRYYIEGRRLKINTNALDDVIFGKRFEDDQPM